jgi:hypothetical protein
MRHMLKNSHRFSADFPDFPPTSSSPLLQIHLAKGSATKTMCLESDVSPGKLNKTQDFGFRCLIYSLVKSLLSLLKQ